MFLKIADKGMVFILNGKEHRTPLTMDISKYNLSSIVSSLHLAGITEYIITGENKPDLVRKPAVFSLHKNEPKVEPQANENTSLLKSLEEKFKRFEEAIMRKLDRNDITSKEQINSINKSEPEEEEAFYIPSIDMSMKLKGSSTSTLSNKEDVNGSVDALASLLKK